MAKVPLTSSMAALSARASDVASELYAIQETCRHAGGNVDDVATELEMLSATLHRLKEEMTEDPYRYTESFSQDLSEIVLELQLVFDEISECGTTLQRADPRSANTIRCFFKKPKVHHLQKHLEALKTTLVVMRTVLHHGKEYGIHSSSSLDEPQPELMCEARAILDAAVATNRDAIIDLHSIDSTHYAAPRTDGPDPEQGSSASANPENPNTLHGAPSASGALPTPPAQPQQPRQNFSLPRRGRRLGVHTFLLNITGHHSPLFLHKEWLHPSRPNTPSVHPANMAAAPSSQRSKDDQTLIMSHELPSSHFSSSSSSSPDSNTEEAQEEDRTILSTLGSMFARTG